MGVPQTDENWNHVIEASLIKGSYVASSTYVNIPTLCSRGLKSDRKLQITPNKSVSKSSKKEIDGADVQPYMKGYQEGLHLSLGGRVNDWTKMEGGRAALDGQ